MIVLSLDIQVTVNHNFINYGGKITAVPLPPSTMAFMQLMCIKCGTKVISPVENDMYPGEFLGMFGVEVRKVETDEADSVINLSRDTVK